MSDSIDTARLTLTRTFAAPPQRVFDAWIDPKQRIMWWGAAPHYTCEVCEIDARVGGRYRCNMRSADNGKQYFHSGEFVEIDPPRRLVFTWSWEDPADPVKNTVVELDFVAVEGGTQLTLTHAPFADVETRDSHGEGWADCFTSLEAYLASAIASANA